MNNFCHFCHQPCGPYGFCDEMCYEDYHNAKKALNWDEAELEVFQDDTVKQGGNDGSQNL